MKNYYLRLYKDILNKLKNIHTEEPIDRIIPYKKNNFEEKNMILELGKSINNLGYQVELEDFDKEYLKDRDKYDYIKLTIVF